MKAKTGKTIRQIRIGVQILFTVLFFYLLLKSGYARAESFTFTDYFFYFDPLLLLMNFLGTGTIIGIFLLSLIPFFLSFVFGRFFCGWVCPMGAVQQFFSWLFIRGRKKNKKKKEQLDRKLLKLKYIILLVIVVSALMGTHIVGWFDPFALLTRSAALSVNPVVNHTVHHTLKRGATGEGIVGKGLEPLYKAARKNVLTIKQRVYTEAVVIGLIFFGLIMLNMYKRRFFCNYLCPLGAMYGLVSRFSLFNLKANKDCISCTKCENNCTYAGSPYKEYMKSECMTCFNCVDDCPTDAVEVSFDLPKKALRTPIDMDRRKMVGSTVSTLFLASLPRAFTHGSSPIHRFMRPPGSIKEDDFLASCVRCGQCMTVCPTNFLQPALFEAGIEGIWTPVLNAQTGYCEFECNKCTQVCPTNAIETLELERKKKFKMGIAVIDKNRCYTYADGYNCAVCEEHCPIPEKAIRFRDVPTWNFKGKLVNVKQIYVVPDLCTGCGICENKCPRTDAPGIIMTAEEEEREAAYDY